MPRSFTDAEMTVFESYVKEHRRKLSSQLNDTYKVLSGSSNPSPVTNAASSGLPAEALIVGIVIAVALWSVVLWIGFKK